MNMILARSEWRKEEVHEEEVWETLGCRTDDPDAGCGGSADRRIAGRGEGENGGSSQMLSISGSFSGTFASDFTYSTNRNGAYGSITAYFGGVGLKTFTYHIDTNGHIEEV